MEQQKGNLTLEYSTIREKRAPVALYVICLLCGLVPLTTALTCTIGFWFLNQHYFVQLGILTLFAGGAMVLFGLFLVTVYRQMARTATINQHQAIVRGKVALWILLANIPAAIFCSIAGIYLEESRNWIPSNW